MQDAINKQINREYFSSYLYLSMAAYFESAGLKGFSNWMRVQALEEMVHVMKFYDFLLQRGGTVTLLDIEAPQSKWTSPLNAFEYAYAHEQKVTGMINDLLTLSNSEKDHATANFLQWFVNEQVEEEASASEIAQKLKLISSSSEGLFMLDRELAARVFTPPPAPQQGAKA